MDIKNLKINLETKILESEKIILIPHNNIDFDAMASTLGLSLVAKKLKKPSHIVISDPSYKIDYGVQMIIDEVKNNFSIINSEMYRTLNNPNDLIVLADVNKDYLTFLNNEIKQIPSNKIVIIDHHSSDNNTVSSDEPYIDTSVSSASEIITKLLCLFKVNYPPEIANYLLAGIYLDTNKLTKNISSETMRIVSKLMDKGANMNRVTDWFAEDFNSDRRVQELVSKAKMLNYSIAIITAEEQDKYTTQELAKAADYLLKYKVDVSFAIGKIEDNIISISARSKEKVDVGAIMSELGGGGNQYSAATKINDSTMEKVSNKLVKVIRPNFYLK